MVIDVLIIDSISTHALTHLNYHIYKAHGCLNRLSLQSCNILHHTPCFCMKVEFNHEDLTVILQDKLTGNLFWLCNISLMISDLCKHITPHFRLEYMISCKYHLAAYNMNRFKLQKSSDRIRNAKTRRKECERKLFILLIAGATSSLIT